MVPQEIGRVVHFTPGRLRLRVRRGKRTPAVYEEVRGLLGTLPGVTGVEITPSTGSVLVTYDPSTLDVAQLLHLGSELGWISPDGGSPQAAAEDWRSYVDVPRATRALTFLGIASIGAMVGPSIGLSARVGSISASIGYLVLTRWAESVRQSARPVR